ncbi:hypothetical protein B566_EDAN019468 [Ephemera danica]|nr:hypothetical protein B566_EDAN019468 [Ephemera danica]
MSELSSLVADVCPQMIAITETWLTPDVRDTEVNLPGHCIYRSDRSDGRLGGGVALYLPEVLTVTTLDSEPWSLLTDSLWCTFRTDKNTNTLAGVIYRPPNAPNKSNDTLLSILLGLNTNRFTNIILTGDFNLPQLDFAQLKVNAHEDSFPYRFLQAIIEAGLTEHVQTETRFSLTARASRLDLIFTNEPLMVNNVSCGAPLGLSDHCTIQFEYVSNTSWKEKERPPRHAYHRADFEAINEGLRAYAWDTCVHATIDDHWSSLKRVLLGLIDKHVPLAKIGPRKLRCWLRRATQKLIAQKRRAWALFLSDETGGNRSEYNVLRNKCNSAVRSDHAIHQEQLARRVKKNPKSFYSYISSISKAKPGIPSISTDSGLTNSDKEAADALAEYFLSIFGPVSPVSTPPSIVAQSSVPLMTDITFSEADVERILLRLNPNKSSGPDTFPPRLFKECANALAGPLHSLFSHSLRVDGEKLQRDLHKVDDWIIINKLPLNNSKCVVLHVNQSSPRTYYLNGVQLASTNQQRDLGTLVDNHLKLSTNTQFLVRKANGVSHLLRRNLGRVLPEYFAPIFCSLVRPLLEVNIQACAPNLQKDETAMENVQRRATKRVAGLRNISYPDRLKTLGMFSLEHRRLRGDMILTHKIMHTLNHPCRSLLTPSSNTNLRGHPLKLQHQRSKKNIRHYSFGARVPRYWNRLPASVVQAKTTSDFKYRFDKLHKHVSFQIGTKPYDPLSKGPPKNGIWTVSCP